MLFRSAGGQATTATTVSTTTTETTTTTVRNYSSQTISLKFSFAEKSNNFLITVKKKGGAIVSAVLYYDQDREMTLERKPYDCPESGVTFKYEMESYNPINELRLDITYSGSLPEITAYRVAADGQKYPAVTNLRGDADCNGTISIADAVLLARYIAEDTGINLTALGKLNADTDQNELIESADLALLLQYLAGVISSL